MGLHNAAALLSLSKLEFAPEAMAFVCSPQKTLWSAFIIASATWAVCGTNCSVVDSFLGEGALTDRAQAARASALQCLVGRPPYSHRRFLTVAPMARAGPRNGNLPTTSFLKLRLRFAMKGQEKALTFLFSGNLWLNQDRKSRLKNSNGHFQQK